MISTRFLKSVYGTFLLSLSFATLLPGQHVYQRGTFVTVPSGKHVNDVFMGPFKAFIAVEDGVLIYDLSTGDWDAPLTASDGLSQYPALLVWQDQGTNEVWIITPDFRFIYDPGSGWLEKDLLPRDPAFSGKYRLGFDDQRVILTATDGDTQESYSALYLRGSGKFEQWGRNEDLALDWKKVNYLEHSPKFSQNESELSRAFIEGALMEDGRIRLDGFPLNTGAGISVFAQDPSGAAILGTQGLGIFYRSYRGARLALKPFGLLTPDVMSLTLSGDSLFVGSRAGVTVLKGFEADYEESIRHMVYDYSFVKDVVAGERKVFMAAREGVFSRNRADRNWTRVVSLETLSSQRIYALALGQYGNLMIATDRNAFIYTTDGLLLSSLYPKDLGWPVYDVTYHAGRFYLATAFGMYEYDEQIEAFTARITSHGTVQAPNAESAFDPIYEITIQDTILWASTSRGLIALDTELRQGNAYLSESAPFQPRGLAAAGRRAWVGTEAGLLSFDPQKLAWRHYSMNDGLVSNFVTDLAADSSYIWVGTNLGLTRVTWQNLY